jgi:hypothetical protein
MDEGDEATQEDATEVESHPGDTRGNNGILEVYDGRAWIRVVRFPNPGPPDYRDIGSQRDRPA